MTRRPHLLYTAWSFPPSRAGGVYRALATVNAFAAAGWEVTVLTVPTSLFERSTGIDPTLAEKVADGVEILRVEPHVAAYENDLSRWSRSRARFLEIWRWTDGLRDVRTFPERTYGRWRPAVEAAAESVHNQHAVDLALGTANPNVDFVAGYHLHRRFGVPYAMDYRDAWTLDVFSGDAAPALLPGVHRMQNRLLSAASEVWFVNDPIRRWHAERFPSVAPRMHVVANGYDVYDVPLAVPVRRDRDEGLVFGYIGTVSDQVPVRQLVEGWRIARQNGTVPQNAKLVVHGYLGHFGDGDAASLLSRVGDGIEFRGPVGKSTIGAVYAGFDALVLALGTGRFVTSGKVFEYAATGIPIVSIHDPGNAATEVVKNAPGWVGAASITPPDIAVALAQTAEIAAAQTPAQRAAAQEWATQYERSSQLAPRIEALGRRLALEGQ